MPEPAATPRATPQLPRQRRERAALPKMWALARSSAPSLFVCLVSFV